MNIGPLGAPASIREAAPNDAKFAPKGETLLTKISVVDVMPRETE